MVFTKYYKHGIVLLISFSKAMQYLSTFQIMELNVFMGQPMRNIVGILCSFEDEQYPSNNIDPWCLIIKYRNEGIGLLVSFEKAMQHHSMCQNICYGA